MLFVLKQQLQEMSQYDNYGLPITNKTIVLQFNVP